MKLVNITIESIHENLGNQKITMSISFRATEENEAEAKHLKDFLKGVRGPMDVDFISAQTIMDFVQRDLVVPKESVSASATVVNGHVVDSKTGEILDEKPDQVEPTRPEEWEPETPESAEQAETPPDAEKGD